MKNQASETELGFVGPLYWLHVHGLRHAAVKTLLFIVQHSGKGAEPPVMPIMNELKLDGLVK